MSQPVIDKSAYDQLVVHATVLDELKKAIVPCKCCGKPSEFITTPDEKPVRAVMYVCMPCAYAGKGAQSIFLLTPKNLTALMCRLHADTEQPVITPVPEVK